jgi:multiple sugar transport system permease protein
MKTTKYYKQIRTGGNIIKGLFRALFLMGVGFVMLYPILFMISNAFKSVSDALDPTVVWIPSGTDLFNFKMAFKLLGYKDALKNTLILVMPCVIIQVITCLFVSYGFARFEFRFKGLLFGLLVFSLIVPVQSYIIPLYVNMKTMHLLDTYWQFYIMALLGTGIRSGLYIYIFRQYFRGLPKELEEAAYIDGCNPLRTFLHIMVPNVKGAILVVFVLSFVWYYNDYTLTGMLLNSDYPLSIALTGTSTALNNTVQGMVGQTIGSDIKLLSDSILSAACLIVALPLIGVYVAVQKHFTEGIERSGLVG